MDHSNIRWGNTDGGIICHSAEMGRSYGIVFGYGSIVTTEECNKVFPGTFELNSIKEWIQCEGAQLEINALRVFHSAGEPLIR